MSVTHVPSRLSLPFVSSFKYDKCGLTSEIRDNVCTKIVSTLGECFCLFKGGETRNNYDTDKEELFHQESFFYYLFGVDEPGCWALLHCSPAKSESYLFIPRYSVEYSVWMGKLKTPDDFLQTYGVENVLFTDEIIQKLTSLNVKTLEILSHTNSDSQIKFDSISKKHLSALCQTETEKTFVTQITLNAKDSMGVSELSQILTESRLIKTERELAVMRYGNLISSSAHIHVMQNTHPTMYEYQLESIFEHYCSYFTFSRYMSYTCICGTGANGATLHYGHAGAPNDRKILPGDMALLDMGAEFHGYATDITCSFPITGRFTQDQKDVYNTVYAAQRAVERAIRPGVEWADMHLLAELTLLTKLKEYGFVRGEIAVLLEKAVAALFMPHGLGHLMGLDVHDVGGYPNDRKRSSRPGLRNLRVHRRLEAGMVLSNEPGVYFIAALLIPALDSAEYAEFLVREKIERFLREGFGGVRLEDNVIVTADGCETMTRVPRSVAQVECCMAGGEWEKCV